MDFAYPWDYRGRRSAVMSTGGMVATSQPLAAQAGLEALRSGGTAADAAVTAAAVLNVVEPNMTGIGGDVFALTCFDGELDALNASGPAPQAATIDAYRDRLAGAADPEAVPATGGLPVTVPGALEGWQQLLDRYGRRDLSAALAPAIDYAQNGVPVSQYVARQWRQARDRLDRFDATADVFLPRGGAPSPGSRFANPALGETFERIAAEGIDLLYGGALGRRVVDRVGAHDGLLTLADLEGFSADWVDPIGTTYRGIEVLEHPPNGQGIVALEALNIAECFDLASDPADPDRLHRLIEAMKIAFADGYEHVADPAVEPVPVDRMRSKDYAADRAADIGSAAGTYAPRAGPADVETVYLSVVDDEGNAVSFINSIYGNFGSGLTVGGFVLQNRGRSFSLDPADANALAPGKRPYHTIIPALIREDGEFRASFGVMGGPMQPQGHLQVVAALVDSGLNPQAAIDTPRFRWLEGRRVALETGRLPTATVDDLEARGHEVVPEDPFFREGGHWGGGQMIYVAEDGTRIGGSDPRKDGHAVGY